MNFLRSFLVRLGLINASGGSNATQADTLHNIIDELAIQEKRPQEEIYQELVETAIARRVTSSEQWARWEKLSNREQQVTALTCLGYSNYQIAFQMTLSPETIKTHLGNVKVKLNLHSKTEIRIAFTGWDFRDWDMSSPKKT